MVCRSPLSKLSDLQGRTVRVASPGLAQLLGALGATPAILPFEDTKAALALAMVDCAVTSAASANYASWTQHTHYFYPLAFQFGFNGYAISLRKWQTLSADEQQRLEHSFKAFSEQLWRYSQTLQQQAESCISGGPCNGQPSRRLVKVPVSNNDVLLLKQLSRQIVLPSWSIRCERKHPGCRQRWEQTVAPIVADKAVATPRP